MASGKRIAVVTGGMGGIGTAICQRLARQGCTVIATIHPSEQEQSTKCVATS